MLWMKDGKLIIGSDGNPLDCDECPCPTCVPFVCDICGPCSKNMPYQWQLVIAGITQGSCVSDCTKLNITTTLTYIGNCVWESPFIPAICADGDNTFQLSNFLGFWTLAHGGGPYTLKTDAEFNCCSENIFTGGPTTPLCNYSNQTATITPLNSKCPANPPDPNCLCSDCCPDAHPAPSTLYAHLSGGGGNCVACLTGITVRLNGSGGSWSGQFIPSCGRLTNIVLTCVGKKWHIQLTGGCSGPIRQGAPAHDDLCNPFNIFWSSYTLAGSCCESGIDITVNDIP